MRSDPPDPLLSIVHVSRSFPGVRALSDVDLTLRPGRITALVGHNGSGKSTLVKVLAGIHQPDPGSSISAPDGSDWRQRIHFIHQDLGLIDELSTVENLDLGRRLGRRGLLPAPRAAERAEATELLGRLGVTLDVELPLRRLSPAQRTMVAIARALSRWPDDRQVLVLDEPTAALHDREADVVLATARRIADRGAAVLYISHRLDEVQRLADEVVVLRDGLVAGRHERGDFTAASLVSLIAGAHVDRDDGTAAGATVRAGGRVRLEVRELSAGRLHEVDLEVRSGEIVGVSGVIGSGAEELLPCVFGGSPVGGGRVLVDGSPVPGGSPAVSVRAGVGFVPRDRHRHAALMALSARENLTVTGVGALRRLWGSVHTGRERTEVRRWFGHARVRPDAPERPFAQFSGGNQQKIVITRWLRTAPAVLLLEEPTQGVDVGAQGSIYALVRDAAASGAAVLVASSDTKELALLCDRVLVMSGGRVVAEVSGPELTEPNLVRLTLSSSNLASSHLAGSA